MKNCFYTDLYRFCSLRNDVCDFDNDCPYYMEEDDLSNEDIELEDEYADEGEPWLDDDGWDEDLTGYDL